jgi:pantoate--beta-alanine ligase
MTASTQVKTIKTIKELRAWKREQLLNGKTVGFVPTMGALHQGHITLVENSIRENDNTVVSIFVNPSQFAPHEDLDSYPRTLDEDIQKLSQVISHSPIILFLPSVTEMYPSGITLDVSKQVGAFVEVKGLSEQLEGASRPQFFRGVATVVTKLLNAVGPDHAYFGQKDIQQVLVVKRMVRDLLMPVEIRVVPIVREDNQLAMSSRNTYLSLENRSSSRVLFQALSTGEQLYKSGVHHRSDILEAINAVLEGYAKPNADGFYMKVEYISIADKVTLKELDVVTPGEGAILSAAVRVPNKQNTVTRLLDNIIFE